VIKLKRLKSKSGFTSVSIARFIMLCVLFSTTGTASADNLVEVDVRARFDPIAAVGLIMMDGKTRQVPQARMKQIGDDIVVSFPYNSSELDGRVTAMVVSNDGELAFGSVKPIRYNKYSRHSIPACADEIPSSTSGVESQLALLESLVQIRSERRATYRDNLAKELSGDFLKRLQDLESGLGLQPESELSADFEPVELADRLSRLKNAIRQFKTLQNP